MSAADPAEPGFRRLGPALPACPVILAVPHAGRDYPAELLAQAALPRTELERLEDRYADLLITHAVAAGATAFVATRARCWIDLNRDEREVDPATVDPPPRRDALTATPKVRAGLGVVPRRAGGRDITRGRLPAAALAQRVATDHRPYHEALEGALAAAQARFGAALLLDCHSMPPLGVDSYGRRARLVIGDRYGRSAGPPLVDLLIGLADGAGLMPARNAPYAGGHTLDRHGQPALGRHAIQLEFDRSLYLQPDLRTPGPEVATIAAFVARAVTLLSDALAPPLSQAAE